MDAALTALLQQHSEYFSVEGNGKIMCRLNGHCLPPRLDAVTAFINGSKFQKLKQRHQIDEGLQRYEPFITVSTNFPTMLYCALTGQLLDKTVDAVKRHMQGQKFKRAQEQFTADKQELKPEPTLESLGVQLPAAGNGSDAAAAGNGSNGAGAAATAEAGGNGDEQAAGFWAPEDGDQKEDADMMENTSGGSDADEGADRMDEDQPHASRRKQPQQAAEASGSSGKRGSKSSKPGASKPSKAGKAGRMAAAEPGRTGGSDQPTTKAKRNVNKPSAAKKARQGDE